MRTRLLVGIAAVACALVAVPGAGATGATGASDKAAAAVCTTYVDGTFHGPNYVYGIDTTGYERAGWGCELLGVGAGGGWTLAAATADPRTVRFRQLCTSSGGTFYLFDRVFGPGAEYTAFVIVGCRRI